MKKIRAIVCGSRICNDYSLVKSSLLKVLGQVLNQVEIVSGACDGADKLGERFAHEFNLPLTQFPAEWDAYRKLYGNDRYKKAGPDRNKKMLKYALQGYPVVIAFYDDKSRGTSDMVNRAKSANVPVYTFFWLPGGPEYNANYGEMKWFPAKAPEVDKTSGATQTNIVKNNNNVKEDKDMKEKILSIMSCNVTTTSYKLQQLNLLRGDAILAHDYESVKLANEHIESLQAVYRAGNETPFPFKKSFNKYGQCVKRRDEKFNIVIENGVDINKEYRTMKKERQHDLFEDMENTTEPCISRAKTTAVAITKEILEAGAYVKDRVAFAKALQEQLITNNATANCGICSMRYHCPQYLANIPLVERLLIQRIAPDKFCAAQSRRYDAKLKSEAKKAKDDKRRDIADATQREARAELAKLAGLTTLGHESNRNMIEDLIFNAKINALNDAINHSEDTVTVSRESKRLCLGGKTTLTREDVEKAVVDFNRKNGTNVPVPSMSDVMYMRADVSSPSSDWCVDIKYNVYKRIHKPSLNEVIASKNQRREAALKSNPLLKHTLSAKEIPEVEAHDIYELLPDVSPAEEIGFSANSPLIITTATGADYEAIVNDIGTKAYPLVKNIIENKVKLPEKYCKDYDIAKEMNGFDIELSGKSHKEVATILSELCERMHEARDFFENCTDKPFVDRGAVPTGTKTEPFYIKHLFDMIDDFTKVRDFKHIDETTIGREEYEELGLPCHLNEDGVYVTTQVATYKDEDDVKHECEFETALTRNDYDHIKFYNMVYRTKSVTVPYATMEDISRHQDEVMKAETSGTDTSEYRNLYNKIFSIVDTKWIANLLNNKFFDQSETRWRRVSLSKIKVEVDDSDDFAPRGSIQRIRPDFQKKDRDVRVNDMVRPELGEGAKNSTVRDVLNIIRRIKNLRKALGRLNDKEVAMLQQAMGSNYREFIQLLAFTDIVKRLEAVLVRNIGETYVVNQDMYLNYVYNKYYNNELSIITEYASTKGGGFLGIDSKGNDCHIASYEEFRKVFSK